MPSTRKVRIKEPLDQRESWWRTTLKETPIPGTYTVRDFLEESQLNPVNITYNFKNEGRSKMSLVELTRDTSLPDTPKYMPPDFVQLVNKQMASYSFKDTPRQSPTTLCLKDKKIDIAPGQYDIVSAPVPKFLSRHCVFRSAVQRFPTYYFIPKEGPGPAYYEAKSSKINPITSCFQSKVPRFQPIRSKTPGPGAYKYTEQILRQPRSIAKMGREHSLFFNNTIGF
ncbi:protein STPG4 isoform X1 [Sarcophilus harrisii]|uniref:Sperm-tail PG-rich repeat containing 4 n=1 Tax=Sarcophilus harrisii TaxID=9305 RepID=G3VD85_SARHA|nr:protein STPG4 isoform X1 [Sarcophilus harrisii]XP_012396378.1 protein STPG4 isoform X1 [Sarcophilus harrisii]